ncbi:MAG: hypothetical protein BGN83_19485 [Rhizobium sp. 63-7]|nr:MAG: hypothetical protein BGN83_19485 [Rhizobium sp. 63-7]
MSQKDDSVRYLSELSGIDETQNPRWQRHLPARAPFDWLAQGWRDFVTQPSLSLAYGIAVFCIAALVVWSLLAYGRDYLLFPVLAGLLIVAPLFATGLYLKSRALANGERVTIGAMLGVRPLAGAQVFFTGMLLCMLMLLWMRAAVIIYALFFGVNPFPGIDGIVHLLLTTPMGWAMLLVGASVGALFAGFAFAIGVFSIPMLLDEQTDAFTAMGTSWAIVWNNLGPMLVWGAIVLALSIIGLATAFVGLVIIFPLLGHATWHAYKAMRGL